MVMPEIVQHRDSTIQARRELFEAVVAELHDRLSDPDLQVDDVARVVFASRRQIQRVMEEHGTTFRERLTELRMEAAGRLLAEQPRVAVRVVAQHVGYRQPAQFAKAFRRHHGHAPSEHRLATTGRFSRAPLAPVAADLAAA